jgi:hypothetical protein
VNDAGVHAGDRGDVLHYRSTTFDLITLRRRIVSRRIGNFGSIRCIFRLRLGGETYLQERIAAALQNRRHCRTILEGLRRVHDQVEVEVFCEEGQNWKKKNGSEDEVKDEIL